MPNSTRPTQLRQGMLEGPLTGRYPQSCSASRLLLQRPPDRILAGAISRGMSEHFRIGIQMTGEVARGALPSEFLVEARDELLDGQPGVPCSTAAIEAVRLTL